MPINKQSPWFLVSLAITGALYLIVLLVQPRDTAERMILGRRFHATLCRRAAGRHVGPILH